MAAYKLVLPRAASRIPSERLGDKGRGRIPKADRPSGAPNDDAERYNNCQSPVPIGGSALDGCRGGRPAWRGWSYAPGHSHQCTDDDKRSEIEHDLNARWLCRITDQHVQQHPEHAAIAQNRGRIPKFVTE